MYTDSLYRFSLKCLIRNDKGEILVVKESERSFWDLPGGGMEHGETILAAIARELHEEVGYNGDFTYTVIGLDEPVQLLSRDVMQIRAILEVTPEKYDFSIGDDADAIAFVAPDYFKSSDVEQEQKVYAYANGIFNT